jgi:aryl-alcohol dehydrogenase-like predicted oxidoreductase
MRPTLFTFGCMSLGTDLAKIDEHVRIACKAMDAGVWFHASPTYNRGFTYMILRMAFDEARHQVPQMIIKIRCGSPRLLRFEVEDALCRLAIDHIDVAQLVFTETGGHVKLVHDFISGGPLADVCNDLRREGKVVQFCPQIDVNSSSAFMPLIERKAFDGYVLYLNPLERDVDDAAWSLLQSKGTPLWALRTVAGALGDPTRLEQLRQRDPGNRSILLAQRVAGIAAKAGVNDWTDFCVRYAAGVAGLQTTIGGTGNLDHLNHFLSAVSHVTPLPADVMTAIDLAKKESREQ